MRTFQLNPSTYKIITPHIHGDLHVEIGDEKQNKFFPRMKIKKWDNEVNFSVGIIDDEPESGQIEQKEDVIKWKKGTIEAHFYPREDLYAHDDKRGHEFEIHLKEKPQSNIINLSIQTKGLDFFYQPEVTSEEKLFGIERPENVIGSYAVYHKLMSGDLRGLGGKHYAAGKAFHIYRPIAHDANGKQIYCDLKIDEEKQIMSITIPQDFLNSALYPIVVDPTFGYTSIGSGGGSAISTVTIAFTSVSPGQSGNVTSMSDYCSDTATGNLQTGIYISSPSSKVATSPSVTMPFSAGWTNTVISPSISNQNYDLTVQYSLDSGHYYTDAAGGFGGFQTSTTFGTWPSSFSWTVWGQKLSVYATYTAASSSSPVAFKTLLGVGQI